MNTRLLSVIALCLLAATSLLRGEDASAQDYADKFYTAWSAPRQPGDDSAGMMLASFYHDVPASMRADVLDQIFDRGFSASPKGYQAMGFVMMCLMRSASDLTISPRLDADLYALAKDSNWVARRDVLHVVAKLKRPKDHDLVVAALNDPKDEVRGAAIAALRNRPDAEATFQKFVQDHQSDPEYHTSVLYAKSGLDAIHTQAPGQ